MTAADLPLGPDSIDPAVMEKEDRIAGRGRATHHAGHPAMRRIVNVHLQISPEGIVGVQSERLLEALWCRKRVRTERTIEPPSRIELAQERVIPERTGRAGINGRVPVRNRDLRVERL